MLGFGRGEEITDRERIVAFATLSGFFRVFENQFCDHREGNFSESVWRGHRANIAINAQNPHFDEFLGDRRGLFSEEFVAFVDGLVSQNSPNVAS
jgi:hypothetical protein